MVMAAQLALTDHSTLVLASEVTQLLQDYNLKAELLPFSKKQLREAAAVRVIKRALGSPPNSTLWDLFSNGELRDNPTPRGAIQVLQDLEGESRATLAGTTNVNINEPLVMDLNPGRLAGSGLQQTNQHLSMDIVQTNGLKFLIGVSTPLGYMFSCYLGNSDARTTSRLWEAIRSMVAQTRLQRFEVVSASSDMEAGIKSNTRRFQELGIDYRHTGQRADAVVEVKIQVLQDRMRSLLPSLPYTPSLAMMTGFIVHETLYLLMCVVAHIADFMVVPSL
jgi:hypothetical protein